MDKAERHQLESIQEAEEYSAFGMKASAEFCCRMESSRSEAIFGFNLRACI